MYSLVLILTPRGTQRKPTNRTLLAIHISRKTCQWFLGTESSAGRLAGWGLEAEFHRTLQVNPGIGKNAKVLYELKPRTDTN